MRTWANALYAHAWKLNTIALFFETLTRRHYIPSFIPPLNEIKRRSEWTKILRQCCCTSRSCCCRRHSATNVLPAGTGAKTQAYRRRALACAGQHWRQWWRRTNKENTWWQIWHSRVFFCHWGRIATLIAWTHSWYSRAVRAWSFHESLVPVGDTPWSVISLVASIKLQARSGSDGVKSMIPRKLNFVSILRRFSSSINSSNASASSKRAFFTNS